MKKRLSLLMAALMIVTMLPMSAFADKAKAYVSVATITDTTKDGSTTVTFEVEKLQAINQGKVAFELVNAKLKPDGNKFKAPTVRGVKADGTQIGDVTIEGGATLDSDDTFVMDFATTVPKPADSTKGHQVTLVLPLSYKDSLDGDVILKVKDLGSDNPNTPGQDVNIGTQDVKIAVVKPESKSLTVKAKKDDVEVSYDGGEVSRFEITNFDDKDAEYLAIELPYDEYYAFDLEKTKVIIDGTSKAAKDYLNDKDGYLILIPQSEIHDKKFITVIPVIQQMGRSASEGTITVNVRNIKKDGTNAISVENYRKGIYQTVQSDSAVIGKVIDFKVTMTVTEKGKKEIPSLWGGEEATVVVELKGPKGSFNNRGVEFEVKDADVLSGGLKVTKLVPRGDATVDSAKGLVKDAIYKDGKFAISGTTLNTTKLVFEMRIRTSHSKNGTATITAAQRGWETTADLAKITPKFTLSTSTTDMKKGETKENANIVITEAKEGLLRTNESITLLFDTTRDYIEFVEKAKVEATNGMTFGTPKLLTYGDTVGERSAGYTFKKSFNRTKNIKDRNKETIAMEIPIKKASKGGAAVITISSVKVKVDGSTVDGSYEVEAGLNGYKVAAADYVKVVKEYGLEPVLTVFTIGQAQYTSNGKPMTAASAPYIKNGRTMLPVRALAESLGLHVQWNGATKTATFTDSTKVAAVVIGSDTMHINGTPVKLSAKAEIVNGTTFIELRSLATVFGVQIDWDAAAKTATVSK